MYSKLFERILVLNDESYHRIIEDPEAFKKLSKTKLKKPGMNFVNLQSNSSILDVINEVKSHELSYLFLDSEDNIVGACAAWTSPLKDAYYNWLSDIGLDKNGIVIDQYSLVGIKENSITMVKDMIDLIKQHLNEYELVSWSVSKKNKRARSIYDRFLPRLKGAFFDSGSSLRYFVSKKIDLEQYQEKIYPKSMWDRKK
jgi:hypothetical protein